MTKNFNLNKIKGILGKYTLLGSNSKPEQIFMEKVSLIVLRNLYTVGHSSRLFYRHADSFIYSTNTN